MIRSVDDQPFHQLLGVDNNVVYVVPPYQREYSWGKEQWDALFDDLLEEPVGSGHFLGTIICVNRTENATKKNVLELVDGQQRMTTLSLLLLALFRHLSEFAEDLDEDQRIDLANLGRMIWLKDQREPRLHLQTQNSNSKDYEYLLNLAGFQSDQPKPNYFGLRRISKADTHFDNLISQLLADSASTGVSSQVSALFDLVSRVKQSIIVKIEVESHSDAYVLFESLNNRGLPLTPIDLIKTNLVSSGEKAEGFGIERASRAWDSWLTFLGDETATQERYFRHFYNALKSSWNLEIPDVAVATKSKLIDIYETLIQRDVVRFIELMDIATKKYGRILGNLGNDDEYSKLDKALENLPRAQGAASQTLALFLFTMADELELDHEALSDIIKLLVRFSLRRNLTNTPPTNSLDRLFISIVDKLLQAESRGRAVYEIVKTELEKVSSSDDVFREKLSGPIYDENVGATRFILISLAQKAMTDEIFTDLWERRKVGSSNDSFVWTIEHILPEGPNLPGGWIQMLGGKEIASTIQGELVHTIGNLTITGYNSSLSNKPFDEKRDRVDESGNFVGYKNGFSLNKTLATLNTWGPVEINKRTQELVEISMELFRL